MTEQWLPTSENIQTLVVSKEQPNLWKAAASKYFDIPYEQVTEEQRAYVKARYWWVMYAGMPERFTLENPLDSSNRSITGRWSGLKVNPSNPPKP